MRRRQAPVSLKDIDWYKYVRRYFWDDETTPYLVPVTKLHRKQADYELFAYCVFMIMLFGGVTLISMTEKAPFGRSLFASMLAFTVACSALILGTSKHLYAAIVCALGPAAALVYGMVVSLQPSMAFVDRILLIVFALLWLRYALRVVHIARSYPQLPEPPSISSGG